MTRLVMTGLILAVALSGCGRGDGTASASAAQQVVADTAAIEDLQVRFHEASSTKNLDLMMTLWADDAILTFASQTYRGKDEIRRFFGTQAGSFKPDNRWVSLSPSPKVRVTVSGERGTIYFECHYVDVDTRQVMASLSGDAKVTRLDGRWLFTSVVAGNAVLG